MMLNANMSGCLTNRLSDGAAEALGAEGPSHDASAAAAHAGASVPVACAPARRATALRLTRRIAGATALALTLLAGIGCEFDASGSGNGMPPELACGLDLTSGQFYTDLEPGMDINGQPVWGGILTPGDPMMFEPFWIGWTVHYFGEPGDPSEPSPPFNTRVEIIEHDDFYNNGTDTVLWMADVPSDPIKKNQYRTDGILIDTGLPPGEYVVQIILDTENVVWECFGLVPAVNNWVEYDLTVLAEPIDDVVIPGGDSPDGDEPRQSRSAP